MGLKSTAARKIGRFFPRNHDHVRNFFALFRPFLRTVVLNQQINSVFLHQGKKSLIQIKAVQKELTAASYSYVRYFPTFLGAIRNTIRFLISRRRCCRRRRDLCLVLLLAQDSRPCLLLLVLLIGVRDLCENFGARFGKGLKLRFPVRISYHLHTYTLQHYTENDGRPLTFRDR